MSFTIICPFCHQPAIVSNEQAGTVVRCGQCHQLVTAPNPPVAAAVVQPVVAAAVVQPVDEAVFKATPRYRSKPGNGGLIAAGVVGIVVVVVIATALVMWPNREPAKETVKQTSPSPSAKAPPPRADPPTVDKPKPPPVTVDREPTFDEAVAALRSLSRDRLASGRKEFNSKSSLFSEPERNAVNEIIDRIGLLSASDAELLARLRLTDITSVKMIQSGLEDGGAQAAAKIIWDRSPRTRSAELLASFLIRYWQGEEGLLGPLNVVEKQGVLDAIDQLKKTDWDDVVPSLRTKIEGSTRVCMLFFNGHRGKFRDLPRDEKNSLIRFAGEEAVLNSP